MAGSTNVVGQFHSVLPICFFRSMNVALVGVVFRRPTTKSEAPGNALFDVGIELYVTTVNPSH